MSYRHPERSPDLIGTKSKGDSHSSGNKSLRHPERSAAGGESKGDGNSSGNKSIRHPECEGTRKRADRPACQQAGGMQVEG